jgi:hypothetical protein
MHAAKRQARIFVVTGFSIAFCIVVAVFFPLVTHAADAADAMCWSTGLYSCKYPARKYNLQCLSGKPCFESCPAGISGTISGTCTAANTCKASRTCGGQTPSTPNLSNTPSNTPASLPTQTTSPAPAANSETTPAAPAPPTPSALDQSITEPSSVAQPQCPSGQSILEQLVYNPAPDACTGIQQNSRALPPNALNPSSDVAGIKASQTITVPGIPVGQFTPLLDTPDASTFNTQGVSLISTQPEGEPEGATEPNMPGNCSVSSSGCTTVKVEDQNGKVLDEFTVQTSSGKPETIEVRSQQWFGLGAWNGVSPQDTQTIANSLTQQGMVVKLPDGSSEVLKFDPAAAARIADTWTESYNGQIAAERVGERLLGAVSGFFSNLSTSPTVSISYTQPPETVTPPESTPVEIIPMPAEQLDKLFPIPSPPVQVSDQPQPEPATERAPAPPVPQPASEPAPAEKPETSLPPQQPESPPAKETASPPAPTPPAPLPEPQIVENLPQPPASKESPAPPPPAGQAPAPESPAPLPEAASAVPESAPEKPSTDQYALSTCTSAAPSCASPAQALCTFGQWSCVVPAQTPNTSCGALCKVLDAANQTLNPLYVPPAKAEPAPNAIATLPLVQQTLPSAVAPDGKAAYVIPKGGLDPTKAATVVYYYYGNGGSIQDSLNRQQVAQQLLDSGCNCALVIPGTGNKPGADAGKLGTATGAQQFDTEVSANIAKLTGIPASTVANVPRTVITYSGGYLPAAAAISGLGSKITTLVNLDGSYPTLNSEIPTWMQKTPGATFISECSVTCTTPGGNNAVASELKADKIDVNTDPSKTLKGGANVTTVGGAHADFVTNGNPIRNALSVTAPAKSAPEASPVAASEMPPQKSAEAPAPLVREPFNGPVTIPSPRGPIIAQLPGPDQMGPITHNGMSPQRAAQYIEQTFYTKELTTFNDFKCASGMCPNQVLGIAHRTWPLGSKVEVCNSNTGKCTAPDNPAVVMDRGPGTWLTQRTIDANGLLAAALGLNGRNPATYKLLSVPGVSTTAAPSGLTVAPISSQYRGGATNPTIPAGNPGYNPAITRAAACPASGLCATSTQTGAVYVPTDPAMPEDQFIQAAREEELKERLVQAGTITPEQATQYQFTNFTAMPTGSQSSAPTAVQRSLVAYGLTSSNPLLQPATPTVSQPTGLAGVSPVQAIQDTVKNLQQAFNCSGTSCNNTYVNPKNPQGLPQDIAQRIQQRYSASSVAPGNLRAATVISDLSACAAMGGSCGRVTQGANGRDTGTTRHPNAYAIDVTFTSVQQQADYASAFMSAAHSLGITPGMGFSTSCAGSCIVHADTAGSTLGGGTGWAYGPGCGNGSASCTSNITDSRVLAIAQLAVAGQNVPANLLPQGTVSSPTPTYTITNPTTGEVVAQNVPLADGSLDANSNVRLLTDANGKSLGADGQPLVDGKPPLAVSSDATLPKPIVDGDKVSFSDDRPEQPPAPPPVPPPANPWKPGTNGNPYGGNQSGGNPQQTQQQQAQPQPPRPPAPQPSAPSQPLQSTPSSAPTPSPLPSPVMVPVLALPNSAVQPVVTLIANPGTVASGTASQLSWASVGTTQCTVFDQNGTQVGQGNPDGSTSTLPLLVTTIFTAACTGASGTSASATTTVTVQ